MENKLDVNLLNNINLVDSINVSRRIKPQNQEDIKSLTDMGFPTKMIKKVYAFLNPVSIEQAILFMTKENEIYQHRYLPYHNKNTNACFICGEPEENHIGAPNRNALTNSIKDLMSYFNRNSSNNSSIPLNKIIIDEKDKEEKKEEEILHCGLCEDEISKNEIETIKLPCNHNFCKICWIEYLKEKITNSIVDNLTCMQHNCKTKLNDDFVKNILEDDKDLLDKYIKFKKNLEIVNNPNKKFCPYPNCDGYAEEKDNNKYVTCSNGHKFCFKCMKNWHGNKDCDEEIDKDFILWKKNTLIKQCPNCKMWTEKNEGCNHMTCVQCKYQWCWLCGGKYTPNHFEIGGPCAGLQFNHNKFIQSNKCALWIYQFFTNFLKVLFIWLFWWPTYTFCYLFKKMDLYDCFVYFFNFFICLFLSATYEFYMVLWASILFLPMILFKSLTSYIYEKLFSDDFNDDFDDLLF